MKRNIALFVLLLALMPALAWAGVISDTRFNALSEGGWNCFGTEANPEGGGAGSAAIVTAPGSAPDLANALRVSFPSGYHDGYNPVECDSNYFNSSEIYQQIYVYFPRGYEFHTIANKLSYDYLDSNNSADNPGNLYIAVWDTQRSVVIHLQPNSPGAENRVLYPNKSWPTIQTDNWYKISWYVKLNDSGSSNGVARLWVNDVLSVEYTDVNMRSGIFGSRNFHFSTLLPIFGGYNKMSKTQADFFYFGRAILSTTPVAGGPWGAISPIQKEPKPPNNLIINK